MREPGDGDGDGVPDAADNCPAAANPAQDPVCAAPPATGSGCPPGMVQIRPPSCSSIGRGPTPGSSPRFSSGSLFPSGRAARLVSVLHAGGFSVTVRARQQAG